MARKRETDCGSTLNPDCCGVVDIVQCELPICRKFITSVVHTSNNVSYDLLYGFHTPVDLQRSKQTVKLSGLSSSLTYFYSGLDRMDTI